MVGVTFFGNFDLASLAIWAFWIFFAGLIIYIQRENLREGFPLVEGDGTPNTSLGLPLPDDKTFILPHDKGTLKVPSGQHPDRTDLALVMNPQGAAYPFLPTGDPMTDGVGPAAWCARADEPELDAAGGPKITPMSAKDIFYVSAGRDPRGLPVLSRDDEVVGHVADMWVDEGEALVRYLEVELEAGGRRMIPHNMARIERRWVKVNSLATRHFAGIPTIAGGGQITKLEEEKVMGWFAGGTLYSQPVKSPRRRNILVRFLGV